jgi:hypothetical protein
MYIEDAKACIGTAEHYGELIAKTARYGCVPVVYGISDNVLKEMGFDKSYNELVKFVPRKPTHQEYAPCDFATYGDCPNCGKTVMDGMGGKDEKCADDQKCRNNGKIARKRGHGKILFENYQQQKSHRTPRCDKPLYRCRKNFLDKLHLYSPKANLPPIIRFLRIFTPF